MDENVHTTKLYDILHTDDFSHIFLVMDFMTTDLHHVLKNGKESEMDEEHMLVLMYKLLCALKFLHECDIIHRDIKPSNILVDDNCDIKICDFGLSRTLHTEERLLTLNNPLLFEKIAHQ